MSNDVTSNERLWVLDTASATALVAAGTHKVIRKLYFLPNANGDDVVIKEHNMAGSQVVAIVLKAKAAATDPVEVDFGPGGRQINGMALTTIDGGTLYVYFGEN
jgi:hypothetical protein